MPKGKQGSTYIKDKYEKVCRTAIADMKSKGILASTTFKYNGLVMFLFRL